MDVLEITRKNEIRVELQVSVVLTVDLNVYPFDKKPTGQAVQWLSGCIRS